jgi:AcrR family transcriptional regulator
MGQKSSDTVDPRVRRTRQLLRQALRKLLDEKKFEEISVQDITEAATVNRATFYDHFTDKSELLDCMVAADLLELLAKRKIHFDGSCASGLKSIVLAVCDYLEGLYGPDCQRRSHPPMEGAIVAVIRKVFVDGLKEHPPSGGVSVEMTAGAVSWAIYGATREWVQTPDRSSSEEVADAVATLVSPILHAKQ